MVSRREGINVDVEAKQRQNRKGEDKDEVKEINSNQISEVVSSIVEMVWLFSASDEAKPISPPSLHIMNMNRYKNLDLIKANM